MAVIKTGWELERRDHFDTIVAQYDAIRMGYPQELIDDILQYAGSQGKKALEIGAGTGKATALFLERGYDVTAVEIGGNMADFLRERFAGNEHFRVIVSSIEDAVLEENSFDLAFSATAFHWVDAEVGCPKAWHILKDGGTFALFRYSAVPADGEAVYEAIQEVYQKYFHKPYRRPVKRRGTEYWTPAEIKRGYGFEDLAVYGFVNIKTQLYHTSRTYNADQYIARLDTSSDHRILPEEDRSALFQGVRDAIHAHGGQFTMQYVYQLYMGRKPLER